MQDKLFLDLGGERAVAMGRYVAETGATVRQAAAVFGVSKSTAHKEKQAGETYPWRACHPRKIYTYVPK